LKDVLESFVAIRASVEDVWVFLTKLDRMTLWMSPLIGLDTGKEGWQELRGGEILDLVLEVPGRPRFRCRVLGIETGSPDRGPGQGRALRVEFEGFAAGVATWHLVPAQDGTIVRHRIEYQLANRWWTIPWALLGRWAAILHMGWQMRRLRDRVEDTVGSSDFGIPWPVSTYALIAAAAGLVLLLGRCICRVLRKTCPRCE
jgi:hypothetical protein